MKSIFALAYIATVSALAIPFAEQARLLNGESAEEMVSTAPASEAQRDALPALLIDGPTDQERSEGELSVIEAEESGKTSQVAEASLESCFCAGGAICCRKGGETDCGFGVCGI